MSTGIDKVSVITNVSRGYSYRGRHVRHRSSTKKYWYAFGFDSLGNFCRVRLSLFEVPFAKLRAQQLKLFRCAKCGLKFKSNKDKCPNCANS